MKKFLILFFLILIITGYTPYTELNDLALVDMIGLEKTGGYLFSLSYDHIARKRRK